MCGGLKSVLFGSRKVSTPQIQKVDPAVTNVTSSDVGSDTTSDAEAARRKKLRQGYAATTLATQTQGKNTLG